MSKVYEVGFKLSAKMASGFSNAFGKASGAVGGLSGKLSDLYRQSANVGSLVKGKRAVAESARAFISAREKVSALGRAMSAVDKPTASMAREFKNAKLAMDRAKVSLDKNRASLRQLETSTGMTGVGLKTLIEKQKELARATDVARKAQERQARIRSKIDATTSAQGRMASMRSSATGSLLAMGATAGAVTGVPVAQAISQEDQRAELRKFSDEYEQVFSGIQKLSLTYAKSTQDMTAMASNAFQSGIAKTSEDALKLVEIQNQMAIAFSMTGDEVGSAYADIQSKMGLTIDESKELFDVVNQIGNSTSASSKDVVEVLTRAGGAVRGLTAMSANQAAALAGAFRSASVSSETASTSMMSFVNALSAGAGATNAQREGLRALGIDAEKMSKMMVSGPENAERAIRDVLSRINALSDEQKSSVIGKIFGNEAGVKSAVATLAAQTDLLAGNFGLLGDRSKYVGSMLKEYQARADTTSNSLTLAKNATMLLSAGIGNALLPAVREMADSFVKHSGVMLDWLAQNQDTIKTVAKVSAGVFGVVAAFHAARLAFSLVMGPILALKKALLMTKYAMAGLNLVMAGNPIALTVVAIGGLIAAGVALYKNWDVIKEKLSAFYESWRSTWQSAKKVFSDAFSSMATIAARPINAVIAMINDVIRSINSMSVSVPDWVPGIGGKSFSANLSEIPKIGEATSAVANTAKPKTASSATSMSFAPVINVQGGGKTTSEEIASILKKERENFKAQMERFMRDRQRLSYE